MRPLKYMRKTIGYRQRATVIAGVALFLAASVAQAATQLSQFGITWTFDRDYAAGQFANGDWWVVGPVIITGIAPASFSGEIVRNGSMINPGPTLSATGYDSAIVLVPYDPNLNVAENISPSRPLAAPPHSSLVSTISANSTYGIPQLRSAAILTVLPEPAPPGSFRPPYCGVDKSIRYNVSTLYEPGRGFDLLGSLPTVPQTPSLADVEAMFERPWIDHIGDWLGRFHHPSENMPDYGREISTNIGVGALMLHLSYSNATKEKLLIRYVQLGIDLYGVIKDGGKWNWLNSGGHCSGRKFPIIFAGLALGDPPMTNIGAKSGDYLFSNGHGPGDPPSDYIHFGEDDQTFYVSPADVFEQPYEQHVSNDFTFFGHGDPTKQIDLQEYTSDHLGLPEWGIIHASDRVRDGLDWDYDGSYRRCCTANSWAGFVLAAHFLRIKPLWNHDALFDYMDLYMAREQPNTFERQQSFFVDNMWDAYRYTFGTRDTIPPLPPTDLASPLRSLTFLKLDWTPPGPATDGNYAVAYVIYRDGQEINITRSLSQYLDTGLEPNTPYHYEVFSADIHGNPSAVPVTADFSTLPDQDEDGLPDTWEELYFNTLALGPHDDPDQDGLSNIVEFQLGTNPTVFDDLPSELVLHIKADDNPADGVLDSSEYAQHGNTVAPYTPQQVSGQVGGAYRFDGIDDNIIIPNASLQSTFPSAEGTLQASHFTIIAWIKVFADDERRPIIAKQGFPDRGFVFLIEPDDKLTLESFPYDTSPSLLKSNLSLATNAWYHVAVTYSLTDGQTARIYINGVENAAQGNFGPPPLANDQDVNVGRYFWNQYNVWHFDGLIDDLRVYNRALNPDEIQQLYQDTLLAAP